MNKNIVNYNCRFFRGDIPCLPHKQNQKKCYNCDEFSPINFKILIIKLAAIGDVIRTTPLLHLLQKQHPHAQIHWITNTPDILPQEVDKKYKFNFESVLTLQATYFNQVINLDKDYHACALTNQINAGEKFGFYLKNGVPAPINQSAETKYLTGLFDDVSQENTKSYVEEIFEIYGHSYFGEEYILDEPQNIEWNIQNNNKKIIGLNTGCGERWISRLWKTEYWIELIELLKKINYFPLLLGGEQEHVRNTQIAKITGAEYKGFFPLKDFISLMNQCDTVVTAVTMGLHIAIGLKKNVILMNNIFNPNEFELYNRGKIVQPMKKCMCYFAPKCKNEEYFCLDSLTPQMLIDALQGIKK